MRKIAKFVGHVISMSIVIGNVSQLMTRSLSLEVATAEGWNVSIFFNSTSIEQLDFWSKRLEDLNSCSIGFFPQCTRIVYSDAKSSGYGGYCVESSFGIAQGLWNVSESRQSSSWRELKAVFLVLDSLVNVLGGQRVKWFTDNQSVVAIVEKGSMRSQLQSIAMDIFGLCFRQGIKLEMFWIPRTENERADYLSKINDPDDWGISMFVFKQLESLWGPYDMDWFASYYNAKVDRFCSRYWNPGSAVMDAFTVSWANKNGWFVPPVYLITRVFLYMKSCKAFGTLIIPEWFSGRYWPFICPDGSGFDPVVKDARYLPQTDNVCVVGRGSNNVFGGQRLSFRMLALLVDCR